MAHVSRDIENSSMVQIKESYHERFSHVLEHKEEREVKEIG